MNKNIKGVLVFGVVTALALPTLTLSSSFVSSLIAGKTPSEAIEIIATQLDEFSARLESSEAKQIEQETKILQQGVEISDIAEDTACAKADALYQKAVSTSARKGTKMTIQEMIDWHDNETYMQVKNGEENCKDALDKFGCEQNINYNVAYYRNISAELKSIKAEFDEAAKKCL